MHNVVVILTKMHKHQEAQEIMLNLLPKMEAQLPPWHPDYLCTLCTLATSFYLSGRDADADPIFSDLEETHKHCLVWNPTRLVSLRLSRPAPTALIA